MTRMMGYVFGAVALCFGAATLFFTWFGVQLVYFALTYEGEGSLGHVGVYIGAFAFPLLAVICGGITWSSWRASRRRLRGPSR